MLKWLNDKLGNKTLKREFAWAYGLVWLLAFINAAFFAEPDRIAAMKPLLADTLIPIAGFLGLVAAVHIGKDRIAGKTPGVNADSVSKEAP